MKRITSATARTRNGEETVSPIHILSSRDKDFEDDGGWTSVHRIQLPRGTDLEWAGRIIVQESYQEGHCNHEHDCCGCAFVMIARTKRIPGRKRELIVERVYRRNI